jgi:hypothetical protein
MAHHPFVVVDDAPPVAGEQTARRDRVQVTPRIHPVATRHASELRTPVGARIAATANKQTVDAGQQARLDQEAS